MRFTLSCIVASLFPLSVRSAFPSLAGYVPATNVIDESRMDLDQKAIANFTGYRNETGFIAATKVYKDGAHSSPFATIGVSGVLTTYPAGTIVTGKSNNDMDISGKLMQAAGIGATSIKVQYDVTGTTPSCYVGNTPDATTSGCFKPNTPIKLGTTTVSAGAVENKNLRSYAKLSADAGTLYKSGADYYPDFKKVVNYYGTPGIGADWLDATLAGTNKVFNGGLHFNFSLWGYNGRYQATIKGALYFVIIPHIIVMLEKALEECQKSNNGATGTAINYLDKAVAFYTGSSEGADGLASGYFLHQLAQTRCTGFKVCGNGTELTGTAKINLDIFTLFESIRTNILANNCAAATSSKVKIAQKAYIPVLQGALRYAWVTDNFNRTFNDTVRFEGAEAEGTAFAAGVLPLIHACNPSDAQIIYNNLKPGQNGTCNFALVKKTFEKNYPCMGMTCIEVGGLYNATNSSYYAGTQPCVDQAPTNAPIAAPVKAPIAAPVKAPIAAPVTAPIATPVAAPVTAPAVAPTAPVTPPCKMFCLFRPSTSCCNRFRMRRGLCTCA